ncbi:nucleolar GTP-binding protein 1 [Sphaeroforma arctica JP610]|uniref:Nucleolar GTP-binding protein 1 n=1 Tax=Sphaeroforma arctica JP610 TaxID=667725 RepID=A0A0L0FT15_9EUKA|nr:nucleolar GTP-binding protein 1 [Sphaeroforma arctica JP610]KNC79721.1 nucleolar GTP-binding protein 1 [Sphaeroforma arctica JP610]|eukprot:XP_014153623.1 nucleolar GTP-binding protein 1 [Sphaeroforma arctica JP610]
MSHYNFKSITVVPTASDFIDITLSKTQRKTPTVVHPGYAIARIRSFYMRKVKFTQQNYHDRLQAILDQFPKLDDIHPFYADLMNVLYDRDHYKLALAQLNTACQLIDNVAKDYNRLLKFGDSLYRCKQLKRAALGRMCTIMKRQNGSLQYLEQVRQHLGRLPSIDPNTRTLILCGFPNVGKSSFMNKVTRADVDVQPYAFTTKSLFVGHMDYRYVRWQVIDTPGVLDQPLERRNTIEMQGVTALAHLRATILYVMDVSEQCGYSLKEQVDLFKNIKALFANKPVMLLLNKADITRPADLSEEDQQLLKTLAEENPEVEVNVMSTLTGEGVTEVKTRACDRLMAMRVENKMKTGKANDVLNRVTVGMPKARDTKERPAFIPAGVAEKKAAMATGDQPKRRTLQDKYLEDGPDYDFDIREHHDLANPEWKFDPIPEILDGKNVQDFIDPEIMRRLEELEAEEDERIANGVYDSEDDDMDENEAELHELASKIRHKKVMIVNEHRENKRFAGSQMPRAGLAHLKKRSELEDHLSGLGIDVKPRGRDMAEDEEPSRGRSKTPAQNRKRKRGESEAVEGAPQDGTAVHGKSVARARSVSRAVSTKRTREDTGVMDVKQKAKTNEIMKLKQRPMIRAGKAGEADRHIGTKMPKHLFSGKRGNGKTDRR